MGFDDAEDLEFTVGANDGVGIDGEIDRGLADGGELVTRTERTKDNSVANLLDELAVNGNAAGQIEAEEDGKGLGGRRHLRQ